MMKKLIIFFIFAIFISCKSTLNQETGIDGQYAGKWTAVSSEEPQDTKELVVNSDGSMTFDSVYYFESSKITKNSDNSYSTAAVSSGQNTYVRYKINFDSLELVSYQDGSFSASTTYTLTRELPII